MSESHPFLTDMQEIRRRAREHVERGAVTPDYRRDLGVAVKLLNEALATEIVCNLRYRQHYFMATGIHYQAVAEEFMEHARDELQHADWLAERIRQLNGKPDFNPQGVLTRSHAEFTDARSLVQMIKEDLIAERVAIETYREMAHWFGEKDPTSRRLFEKILEKEEEHADDLASLLDRLGQEMSQDAGTRLQ